MNRFKEKFMQFMYGRYGIDTLGKWTVGLGLAIMLIAGWTSNSKLSLLSWVLIIPITGCFPEIFINVPTKINSFLERPRRSAAGSSIRKV